jgi:hypothetical protein
VNLNAANPNYHGRLTEDCTITQGAGGDILLWGDSFAAHYGWGLQQESERLQGRLIQFTAMGCPPAVSFHRYDRPHCALFNRRALEIIDEKNIRRVVLTAVWASYHRAGMEQIDSTLAELRRRGVETTVIGQSPLFFMDPVLMEVMASEPALATAARHPMAEIRDINAKLAARALAVGARFIDPTAHLCAQGPCSYRLDGVNLFIDGGHYAREGSSHAVRAFFPYIQR